MCHKRLSHVGLLWCCIALILSLTRMGLGLDEETDAQRRTRLASLSAEQKESLLQKKERFEALTMDEQERLRKLHEEINSSPKAERLQGVLHQYHDWFKTLNSSQQAELKSLSPEKRLAKIKEIQGQQKAFQFRTWIGESAGKLSDKDSDLIYAFLEDWVRKNEEPLLAQLPEGFRDRLKKVEDSQNRHRQLILIVFAPRPPWQQGDSLRPSEQDYQKLIPTLSPEAQRMVQEAKTPEDKRALAATWVGFTVFRKGWPPVKKEELQKLFSGLDPDSREKLLKMDAKRMEWELTRMYYFNRRGEGGQRGQFGGNGGFGPGGRSGDGFRPERSGGEGRFPKREGERPSPSPPPKETEAKEPTSTPEGEPE